jgi:hypothetical protein
LPPRAIAAYVASEEQPRKVAKWLNSWDQPDETEAPR